MSTPCFFCPLFFPFPLFGLDLDPVVFVRDLDFCSIGRWFTARQTTEKSAHFFIHTRTHRLIHSYSHRILLHFFIIHSIPCRFLLRWIIKQQLNARQTLPQSWPMATKAATGWTAPFRNKSRNSWPKMPVASVPSMRTNKSRTSPSVSSKIIP